MQGRLDNSRVIGQRLKAGTAIYKGSMEIELRGDAVEQHLLLTAEALFEYRVISAN